MASRLNALARRLPAARGCLSRPKRGGGSEPWWSEGTHKPRGNLFGETPPPPGQTRSWEMWEAPYYFTGIATVVLLVGGLTLKPDTRITTWAKEEYLRREALENEK
mmetsp:Transcript_7405/g.27189  ORF Transcript_7405/g.27189 Transcript_7405/m.27189 type:complete len:106 (+) Transcript_7405:102-419(+)